MDPNNTENYITPQEAAARLMVLPSDILNWINEGKLKGIKQEDGKYLIALKDYQKFGSSFPKELRDKMGKCLWTSLEKIRPLVQEKVSSRFRHNSKFVLDRTERPVQLLEKLHKKYEPNINIFNDKRGATACFIIYARVISLLYSMIKLLRSSVPAESFILFRPLWEAILLAEYFMFSDASNENQKQIRRWFEKDETPSAREVRDYLSKKLNIPIDTMRKLHKKLSKPIHHTYKVIMESYRGISMSGFLGHHTKRLGFDYHQSSIMRDIISLISGFEALLLSALQGFHMCFSTTLPLTDDESRLIKAEIDFYSLDPLKRLDIVFSKNKKHNG